MLFGCFAERLGRKKIQTVSEKIFANLSSVADRSHRRIDEVVTEKIKRDFAIDADESARQIAVCSDKEILKLSAIAMSPPKDARLSLLVNRQNEGTSSTDGQKEMWQLMETSRLTILKKAYALREISRRGLDSKN